MLGRVDFKNKPEIEVGCGLVGGYGTGVDVGVVAGGSPCHADAVSAAV